MTEELRNPDLKDSARRKLVRGAFSVPAVLTLHGGSVIAATSAANCLVNRARTTPTEFPSTTDDIWLRYRTRVQTSADGTVTHWISGKDLDALKRNNVKKPFVAKINKAWAGQKFDPSSNTLIGTPTSDVDCTAFPQNGQHIVLRVDDTGAVVGAGASGSIDGLPASDSCWTSFFINTV